MGDFDRPVRMPSHVFSLFPGGEDPAEISRVAHETAWALVGRVRADPRDEVVERLVTFTDEHGIDAVAELWSRSPAISLPGALWRIHLIRAVIRQDPELAAHVYSRGAERLTTIDPVVAGAVAPTGPAEVADLADRILRGAFAGDLAVALDRAGAYCRVASAGFGALADDADLVAAERAAVSTTRAARFADLGRDLAHCARRWRRSALD